MMNLPEEGGLMPDWKDLLEDFVFTIYCLKVVDVNNILDLRWHLFCKQLAESNKLSLHLGNWVLLNCCCDWQHISTFFLIVTILQWVKRLLVHDSFETIPGFVTGPILCVLQVFQVLG